MLLKEYLRSGKSAKFQLEFEAGYPEVGSVPVYRRAHIAEGNTAKSSTIVNNNSKSSTYWCNSKNTSSTTIKNIKGNIPDSGIAKDKLVDLVKNANQDVS